MLRGRVQGVLGVSRALGPVEFWPLLMGRRDVIASRSTCHCCRLGRIPAVRHARADGGRRPSASRRHPAARFRRRVADPQRQMHRGPAAGTAVRGTLFADCRLVGRGLRRRRVHARGASALGAGGGAGVGGRGGPAGQRGQCHRDRRPLARRGPRGRVWRLEKQIEKSRLDGEREKLTKKNLFLSSYKVPVRTRLQRVSTANWPGAALNSFSRCT